jgi:4-diphosphocytidyl-2C-methyl-D-erythritol kinase
LATPDIEIDRKTARLYGALTPGDFSDGETSLRVASALRSGSIPAPADLTNAFSRPLRELVPAIAQIHTEFLVAGAPFVALSGAGPTQYTLVGTLPEAIDIAQSLASRRQFAMRVMVARPVPSGIKLRRDKTPPAASAL